jgi:hypothetical protein
MCTFWLTLHNCTQMFVHRCLYTNVFTQMFVHRCLYKDVCTQMCVHRCLYTDVCTKMFVHRCLYKDVCTQMFVHRCLYTQPRKYKQLRTCARRSALLYGGFITAILTWASLVCVIRFKLFII